MPCYVISYDLDQPGQDYEDLFELIKSYGTWCHAMESTWFIVTDEDAQTIRDYLLTTMDSNDKLFVGKLSGEGAWSGLGTKKNQWLKKNL